jgi:hypothetical protein
MPITHPNPKFKSRVVMSNPFADIPHEELLERAGIVSPKKHYKTVDLPNGRITLHDHGDTVESEASVWLKDRFTPQ